MKKKKSRVALYAFSMEHGGLVRSVSNADDCKIGTVLTKDNGFDDVFQCFIPLIVAEKKFICTSIDDLGKIIFLPYEEE